jgi:hypothetical protein
MPLNRWMPDKPLRVAQNKTTTVGANSDAPKATLFTVPTGRKFTLYGVGTDQNAASVDLLAAHIVGTQAVFLIDMPTQRLSTDERVVPQYEVFNVGESLVIGLRNGTGAGITPQLYAYYTDESA